MKLYLEQEDEEYEVHIEGWEQWCEDNGFDDLTGYVVDEDNEDMPLAFFQEILQANVNKVEEKLNEAKEEYDEQERTEAMLGYVEQY